jgi:hypothetical protein
MRFKVWVWIAVVGLVLPLGSWAASAVKTGASGYYQQALEAYLAGDYDQAILLDSRAIAADPKSVKATALLNVLVTEKDQAGKTVIWIGGKPAPVQKVEKKKSPAPVIIVKKFIQGLSQADQDKLKELEDRVQTVGLLMEKESQGRFKVLTDGQVQTNQRLEEVEKSLSVKPKEPMAPSLISLLALLIACAALALGLKTRRDQARLRYLFGQFSKVSDSDKVVNFSR